MARRLDFKKLKPSVRFWINLKRLVSLSRESRLIQRSVFIARRGRVASALKKLVEHYGGRAKVFSCSFADV